MSDRSTARRPGTRAKLALILLPPLLLLVVAEIGTRAFLQFQFGRMVPTQNWTFEYEPYLLVKKSGRVRRTFPVAEDQYRVLLLGGSTAAQIDDGVFRREVKRYTDRDVVIMNLGEGGYILEQEKVMLMLRGIESKPDLIITLDGANDFATAAKLGRIGEPYHADLVRLAVERPFANALFGLARKSQFVNALAKLRERRSERASHDVAGLEDAILDHLIAGWDAIAAVAHGMNVPYVMVLQPYLHLKDPQSEGEQGLAPDYDYRREFMVRMFRAARRRMATHAFPGAPYVVDGTVFFDGMPEVSVFLDEVHMTRAGERLLVREMLRSPHERGLRFPQVAVSRRDDGGLNGR